MKQKTAKHGYTFALVTLSLVTRINEWGHGTMTKSLTSFGVFVITLSHVVSLLGCLSY